MYPNEVELKAMAYRMKTETGNKLGHCYEQIAKNYGFKTYSAMREVIKKENNNE